MDIWLFGTLIGKELVAVTRALDRVLLNQHYGALPLLYLPITKHRLVCWDGFGQPETPTGLR